jgi:hypothetical protein
LLRDRAALGCAPVVRLDEHAYREFEGAPLCQAIAQTFDGAHPCSLCHVVATGKASEKKTDVQSPVPRIDIICVARVIRLISPVALFEYALRDFSVSEIEHSPPVPPPRVMAN